MNQEPQAVFLDRDGVLNRYVRGDYIRSAAGLHLLPGVAAAVRRINDLGIPAIVISNQQGVGKGLMTQADLDAVNEELHAQLQSESGAALDKVYYCVHMASEGCECRKPKPGMILQAAAEFSIDLSKSVFIGDSLTDIETANNAQMGQTILLTSGATEIVNPWELAQKRRPTLIARDLIAAVTYILEDRQLD